MVQFIKIESDEVGIYLVTKMGSTIGHGIEYNGVGALRGQRHIPSKNLAKYPAPRYSADTFGTFRSVRLLYRFVKIAQCLLTINIQRLLCNKRGW